MVLFGNYLKLHYSVTIVANDYTNQAMRQSFVAVTYTNTCDMQM